MDNIAIKLEDIEISFGNKKVINKINLNIEENKIYGLLGKNGIGKTTLLNSLVGGLKPNKGTVKICDIDPYEDPRVLENVCIVREQETFAPDTKVKEIFKFYHIFFPNYDKKLEKKLIEFFELPINKAYKTYSRGMKTLIMNIVGLCSKAPIVIYDEPAIGLDAVNRTQFYEILLEEYNKNPRTIILSTHLIEEVDSLLEKVVILDKGQVIVDSSVDELKMQACYITGREDDLKGLDILKDKKPKQSFGKVKVYVHYGELAKKDLVYMEEHDIECSPIELQKLFVELTRGKEFNYERD